MILLLISLIMFTAGVTYTWIRWGVQKSFSQTFYSHENVFLWYLWCILYPFPVMIAVPHGLVFLSAVGIMTVGAAPNFNGSKLQNHVHVGGAYIAIIAIFLFLALKGQWIAVIPMALFTVGAALLKLKNLTNWVEIAAFYLSFLGLMRFLVTL